MKNRRLDIERYLRGELSPAEMHALEREALDDPFLSEALEGIEQTGTNDFLYDLHNLKHSVNERMRRRPRREMRTVRIWHWVSGVAATLLIIAISGFLVVSLLRQQHAEEMAMNTPEAGEAPAVALPTDTLTLFYASPGMRQPTTPAPAAQAEVSTESSPPETRTPPVASAVEPSATDELRAEADVMDSISLSRDLASATATAKKARTRISGLQADAEPQDTRVVRGRVTDSTGNPLADVKVTVRGSEVGVMTDGEGRYQLPIPRDTTLVFTLKGFKTFETKAKPGASLDVELGN